jgi:hypothetical protein
MLCWRKPTAAKIFPQKTQLQLGKPTHMNSKRKLSAVAVRRSALTLAPACASLGSRRVTVPPTKCD